MRNECIPRARINAIFHRRSRFIVSRPLPVFLSFLLLSPPNYRLHLFPFFPLSFSPVPFLFFFFSFQHRDERIERRGDEGEDRISVRTNAKITFHLAGHEEFIGTKVVGRAGRRRRAVPRSELKDYPAGRGQQRFKLLLYFRRQCTRTFQSRFESGVHDRLGNFETTTTRRTCPSGPFRLHLPGTHFPQLGNSTVRDPMDYLSPFLSISLSLSLPSSLGHKFA